MFDSITQDNRLAISHFYCFWFVRTVLKNVKKFSRIVCVSLFSYQGFPLVCFSDSSFILSHLFLFVKNFFQVFSNFFESRFRCRFVDDLDTLSYLLSFVNCEFHFSEILFNCLFFKNNYLRQLSYNTTGSYACQP